ncbi:MAG: SGNH/GDSL hydrolase family protein [Myxococcota bacterium]
MRTRIQKLALFLLSLFLFLGAAEAVFRIFSPERYHVWPPRFEARFRVHDRVDGIEGDSQLTINSFGVRGDEYAARTRYRILAIGGSTTICSYLDDLETWPHLVQVSLNEALGPGAVWVGNVGRAGHTTVQHKVQVEKLLAQHPEIDAVILLVGINDMLAFAGRALEARTGSRDRPLSLDKDPRAGLRIAFSVIPLPEDAPWYQRTLVGRLSQLLAGGLAGLPAGLPEQDEVGTLFLRAREHRQQAGSWHPLPDLDAPLRAYRRNLETIFETAAALGDRVIFLTQPTLWRRGLPEEERTLLWMGGPPLFRARPEAPYYTVEALAAGMERYNQLLLSVCRERNVECIDVARTLPKDRTVHWDDAHFTELGARRLAERVATHLLETPPLAEMARSARDG